jgi:BirA family biotin operon repressor/biotin-[acetyl-CoA-carboxylase] ligase
MLIYSDNKDLIHKFIGNKVELFSENIPIPEEIKPLFNSIFLDHNIQKYKSFLNHRWNYIFLVKNAKRSHFDLLLELNSRWNLPDGIVCIAENGNGFHGFRNRHWAAQPGNLHISVFFRPQNDFKFFHPGLLIAAAVSIIKTIDSIPELKGLAKAKWVNDICIDNSKVAGIITQTFSYGNNISGAILGIGLNVESTPVITTDKFTPKIACLKNFTDVEKCNMRDILDELLLNLQKHINMINSLEFPILYENYCSRSAVIGKNASIYSDPLYGESEEIISGKVIAIKKNLELILEDYTNPVNKGRLTLNE